MLTDAAGAARSSTASCSARTTTTGLLRPERDPVPWEDAGRGRDGDDQLHLGHDGAPEGRADHPSQHLDQRGHLRAAHRRHRPRRLPAHAADVPLQRLGNAVRDGGPRGAAGRAAQGRRHRDPAPRPAARRHPRLRRAGGVGHGAGGRRDAGTGRSPAATACASSSPARRRPPASSPGSRRSSAGSSPRSTGSPRPRRWSRRTAPAPSGTASSRWNAPACSRAPARRRSAPR